MTKRQKSDSASRWYILAGCIAAMTAIANLQYAWTLFVAPLTENLNSSQAAVQWAFTFFALTQTWLAPANAYLIDRFGPRLVVSLAAVLVGYGWIGAGLAASLPVLYTAYAVGGLGAGAVYGACIGIAMKWFPDRRGLCVGAVAGAYGSGTVLTVLPISNMIATSGYQSAFITWGIVQGVIVLIAAQFLRMPPSNWAPAGWDQIKARVQSKVQQSSRDYSPREMLKTGSFYVLYLMMTFVCFSGLMVTVQLAPIGKTYGFDKYLIFGSMTALNLALLLDRVLNGLTRPFFGWVSDHIGRYDTMAVAFAIEAFAITAFTVLVDRPLWFVIISGLTFFAWGEIYSLFPSAIADVFGAKHATTNYGIQYTSKGLAAIFAGPFSAMLMEATNSWVPVFWTAVACNVSAAALAIFWLKPRIKRMVKRQEALAKKDASDLTAVSEESPVPAVVTD